MTAHPVESGAPTRRGRETETALLQAARDVFAEQGYFGARVADIARRAGRSPASFYGYFASKEALLERLADRFAEDVLERTAELDPHATPWEQVVAAVRAYRRTYRDYQPVMVGVFQRSMTDPEFAERWRHIRAQGIATVLAGMRSAHRSGFARGLDLDVVASQIVTLLESSCYVWYVAGGDDLGRPFAEDDHVEAVAQIWYRTLFFPPTLLTRRGRPKEAA